MNLYYSVIKFLSFEGIIWAGDSLPLVLSSLGDLFQVQIQLNDRDHGKVKASWERGLLHAAFQKGHLYDLSMRLEYALPTNVTEYKSDFDSIHPKSYRVGLDFSAASLTAHPYQARFRLGERVTDISLEQGGERLLDSGLRLQVIREHDYFSFALSHDSDMPFSHRHFPILSLV